MPSRKSGTGVAPNDVSADVSMISNATATSTPAHARPPRPSCGRQDDTIAIDDLLLPRTLVQRLARGVLPANTSIQKDATLALAKSATVFISYLAHHANEQSTKKTLGPQDVLNALREIELAGVMDLGAVGKDGRLGGRLERELELYEEKLKGKRQGYRDKVKARESGGGEGLDGDGDDDDERGEPSNKRARRISDDSDADEEERMLEQQLNGTTDTPSTRPQTKHKQKAGGTKTKSMLVNGKATERPKDPDETEEDLVDEDEDDEVEEGDGEDDGDEDDEEQDTNEDDNDEDEDEDMDQQSQSGRRSTGRTAMFDERADAGSEDDSD